MLVFDFGAGATKVVVFSRHQQTVRWERALLWPSLNDGFTLGPERLSLRELLDEERLSVEYASALVSTGGVLLRLLNFPGRPTEGDALLSQVRQTLGVDENFSVQCQVVQELAKEAGGKEEYSVLAAAIPSESIARMRAWMVDAGLKPISLRVAGVTTANLAQAADGLLVADKAVGVLEVGVASSLLLIFLGHDLALARQFKFGSQLIVENLRTSFELDAETAIKLYKSGSFDFSANVGTLMGPWLHQLAISLDFFERRFGRTVGALHLFGGGAQSKVIEGLIAQQVRRPVERWSPLDGLGGAVQVPSVPDGASPELFALAASEAVTMIRSGEKHAVRS